MASGGGGGGGAGVCNKRCRRSADDDDGETSGRNKRFSVGPSSGANDDGENGDFYDGAGSEDYMYGYDDEEAEQSEGGAAASACDDSAEQRYVVLTESDVRARQEADTAKVAEVLSIPAGFAAVLLRHFKWRVGRVHEEWFTDDRRVRRAVGLPAPAEDGDEALVLVPDARSPWPVVCGICFDPFPAGRTRSAGCSHYYCDGCWGGYVSAAVGDGARCLSLRCPDPSCPAPVVRELVDAVAAGAADVRARYARFWLRSYVEESGGRIKWCGGAGCTRSVEFDDAAAATDVFCGGSGACRHGFCWRCGEEAHRPVSCGTVRAWLAKNASDSETANWVAAHTKRCPKCRRPIEKSHGCNHMTCGAPCRHQFCWLCFDPWDNHRGCTRYDYRQRQVVVAPAVAAGNEEEEARRRQAKASLDRYLYHYERWEGNGKSLQKAIADADELERSELGRIARLVDVPAMELGFLTEAYRQIADGRRVLRWAHAYAYFLFLDMERERDGGAAKRDLFDDLQSQANRWLECLHGCAELEREELFGGADGGGGGESITVVAVEAFRAYKEKVANLTGVTRKFMGNLVKAFKTNLPEVVVTPAFDLEHIVNGLPMIGSQTAGAGGIISTATVTMEPAAMLPMISGPHGFWRAAPTSNVVDSLGMSTAHPSSSSLISQQTNIIANDGVQEHRGIRNPVQQPVRPGDHLGGLPSNLSQYPQMSSTSFGEATTSRALPNTGARAPLQVHMSNQISNLLRDRENNILSSGVPSVTFSMSAPGQPIGSFGSNSPTAWDNLDIAASSSQPNSMGMDQQAGMNPLSSAIEMNVPIGMHPNDQQTPPKYVKIWEGNLSGQRQGLPVFISKLESWSGTLSKTIAADWPKTMQIVRLIAQEHMNKKQYVGKPDFLIFRTLNQHGFFGQLQEKKLCVVIQLPSQTLLLSMSDKAGRMIGMLFPENMVMFKSEVLTQRSLVQHEKLQHQQELRHQQLQLQQQQQPNIQQLIEQKLELRQQQQQQNIQQLIEQKQELHRQQQLQPQRQQNIQQLIEQKQMQQMQQRMQVSTQNLPMQQHRLHQQQLQDLQQLQHQQQQLMQEQLQLHQMQCEQQLRQQIQQQNHQQQQMQQMQSQQQLLPQMVGTELASDDERED